MQRPRDFNRFAKRVVDIGSRLGGRKYGGNDQR